MKFQSRLRTWINRDDGTIYRAGNKQLGWHEIVGYLLLILSLGLFGIPALEGVALRRFAPAFLAVAIILLIVGAVLETRNAVDDDS